MDGRGDGEDPPLGSFMLRDFIRRGIELAELQRVEPCPVQEPQGDTALKLL